MKNKLKILDTTLRDGSYAINFKFSVLDVVNLVKELESSGIEYIEIGHGMGLGGSKFNGKALQTDEEYLEAASNTIRNSKFGMFCIPGIATLEDIELAAKYKMDFIRIGTNVNQIEDSKEFIRKAKDLGMEVMANYMKSYALDPKSFAKNVKKTEEYGADTVYIVDSAGGMLPEQIRRYFDSIKEISDIKVGFHGHNNLGMAVANSFYCAELGMDLLDSSLQGLGRSAGNAQTELLLAVLLKSGFDLDINLDKIIKTGNELIKPLIHSKGLRELDIVSGYYDFHSSYMEYIHKYSAKYKLDPLKLIEEVTKVNKISVDDEIMKQAIMKLDEEAFNMSKFEFESYLGGEQNENK